MRGVRHEAPHLLDGALDRSRRLTRQHEPPHRDQHESRQRGSTEDADQGRVLLADIRPLSDDDRDVRGAGASGKALAVQSQLMTAVRHVLHVRAPGGRRDVGRVSDPRVGLSRRDGPPVRVEEVELPVRDVQLRHRVGVPTGCALSLQIMSRADNRGRSRDK